jgi:hypothetical protein
MNISSSELNQIQTLLDKIGVIDFQYQKTRTKNKFNIFNLLSKRFDEVNFHSKFIHELLNPKGSHGYGFAFLGKLLSELQLSEFKIEDAEVYKEYKNIDILIKNNRKQAIVIENKLWAVDQPAQLERYYKALIGEGFLDIKIFYLSIDGKDAEDHSIGELNLLPNWATIYTPISYNHEIDQWIECCIKEAYNHPALRETLIQYKSLINEITGKTMNNEERHEILELIAKGDNVLSAKKIAENWVHVRWHTEWDFWSDLENKISTKYNILELQKYSADNISSVVHYTRNRNYWYGIMFEINKYKGDQACIFIERSDGKVYYGLTTVRENSKRFNKEMKFSLLAEKIQEISEWGWEDHWIGGKYCYPEINFNSFSNEATLRLINPDFRENYINKLWLSIKEFAEQCNNIIDQLNKEGK